MQSTWKQDEVFPIIAHIIEQQFQQHQRYITSHEIAAQLVQDDAAKPFIQHAQSQQRKNWSPEQLAHNMVAWFSQRSQLAIRLGPRDLSARRLTTAGLTSRLRTRLDTSLPPLLNIILRLTGRELRRGRAGASVKILCLPHPSGKPASRLRIRYRSKSVGPHIHRIERV